MGNVQASTWFEDEGAGTTALAFRTICSLYPPCEPIGTTIATTESPISTPVFTLSPTWSTTPATSIPGTYGGPSTGCLLAYVSVFPIGLFLAPDLERISVGFMAAA